MRLLILLSVMGMMLTSMTFSKEITSKNIGQHSVGWTSGSDSFLGLTYRYWSKTGNGFQTTILPVIEVNNDSGKTYSDIYVNFDISGLRNIHDTEMSHLMLLYGTGVEVIKYQGEKNKLLSKYIDNSEKEFVQEINYSLNIGGQLGVNLYPLVFNIGGGVAAIYKTLKDDDNSYKVNPYFSLSVLISTLRF